MIDLLGSWLMAESGRPDPRGPKERPGPPEDRVPGRWVARRRVAGRQGYQKTGCQKTGFLPTIDY